MGRVFWLWVSVTVSLSLHGVGVVSFLLGFPTKTSTLVTTAYPHDTTTFGRRRAYFRFWQFPFSMGFLLGRMTIYPCLRDAAFPDGGFHRHGFVLFFFFGWRSHLTCFFHGGKSLGILESEVDSGEVEKEI